MQNKRVLSQRLSSGTLPLLASIALMSCATIAARQPLPESITSLGNTLETALPQTAVFDMAMEHMDLRTGKTPKVLVIGIDGTRADAVRVSGLDALVATKLPGAIFYFAYAGGNAAEGSLQPTFTAPGFTSILTGKWAKEHGIADNFLVNKKAAVRSFPAAVVEKYPDKRAAVLAAWEGIVNGSTYGDNGIYRFVPGNGYYTGNYDEKDPAVVAETDRCIGQGYDVLFAVIDMVDHNGHLYGFSPTNQRYTTAISRALGMAGQMIDAIRARPSYADEDWLVILTTDHGGKGRLHGGQSPEERGTFILRWDSAGSPAADH
jgi:predicted AlkP superfamily pyrophosphatase or phosphodiesterase